MKFSRGTAALSAVLLASGCGKGGNGNSAPAPAAVSSPAPSGNPVAAPLNYIGAAVRGEQSAVKTIDTVSLNKDIQLFNVQEGRNPTSLDELVAKNYIGKLPQPPTGMKLAYDPVQGKVTVVKQ